MYTIEIDREKRILKLLEKRHCCQGISRSCRQAFHAYSFRQLEDNQKRRFGESSSAGIFMQLSVPWGVYGIHGTDKPWSVGQAVSHGCVRMYNKDAAELYDMIALDTPVLIY